MNTESPTTLPARQVLCAVCNGPMYFADDPRHEQEYEIRLYDGGCVVSFDYTHVRCWSRRTASVGADAAAKRVADYLFENGSGEHADRLVLTKDATGHAPGQNAKDLGGWCKQSVVDAILAEFASASSSDAAEEFNRGLEAAEKECNDRASALDVERGKSNNPTERRTLLAKSNIATGLAIRIRALREAERRIRAAE